jgi:hypothetical protein
MRLAITSVQDLLTFRIICVLHASALPLEVRAHAARVLARMHQRCNNFLCLVTKQVAMDLVNIYYDILTADSNVVGNNKTIHSQNKLQHIPVCASSS